MQRRSRSGRDLPLTCKPTPAIGGSSLLPLSLRCTFCPPFLEWELLPRTQPRESSVLLGPSGRYVELNPVTSGLCINVEESSSGCGDLLVLRRLKINLVSQCPCLLKRPSTEVEGPLSSVSSCPSHRGSVFEPTGKMQFESFILTSFHLAVLKIDRSGVVCYL